MNEFLDAVENGIKEYWPWLLAIILGYFFWRYNLWHSLIRELLPLIGTIFLGWVAWKLWVHYIRQDFISGIDFVLLEIIPPRDVERNPKAMELFITNALYHWSMKGGKESYWQGAVWFWFSLELVSLEGQVHFYIRTPSRIRSLIETQMYAQYPQAQVKVVEDYTLAVDKITPSSAWNAWGCEFGLLKPEAYPIKTYIDFGLDKDPKEEYKIDPISPIIEFFGSLGKGEQAWMQVIITLARIEVRVPSFLDRVVKAMSAKTGKLGFETGIRIMYLAKKEVYPVGSRTNNSRNIRLIFRQYTTPDSNGLNRINSAQADAYGGIFTLPPHKIMRLANRMLHEYRERSFFHLPLRHHLFNNHKIYLHWPISRLFMAYKHPETFVLNTEELATLWHFPGQILKVPTLTRIESKEASPPPNLPI